MVIRKLTEKDELSHLVDQAESQGHRFVRRLVDEITNGENRFDQPGEALFVAEQDGRICGVCGLNRDPYSNRPNTSRLRHLFIDPNCRGQGVGTALVEACLSVAEENSDLIVLRTHCGDASSFYTKLGFQRSSLPGATHERSLAPSREVAAGQGR
jgi:N-acetylglutamate synthase-like GNAT family acetyltransferase